MNKPRSDSTWAALAPEQKEKLIQWLFEQNLSYKKVLARVQAEFGLTASLGSLARYYQVLARERLGEELCEAQATAAAALSAEGNLADLRSAALKLIGKKLIDCAIQPGMAKELYSLSNLMLLNHQQEIQSQWLALARERFHHKAAQAALQALPIADQIAADNEALETARVEAIKLKLFGPELLKDIIE